MNFLVPAFLAGLVALRNGEPAGEVGLGYAGTVSQFEGVANIDRARGQGLMSLKLALVSGF